VQAGVALRLCCERLQAAWLLASMDSATAAGCWALQHAVTSARGPTAYGALRTSLFLEERGLVLDWWLPAAADIMLRCGGGVTRSARPLRSVHNVHRSWLRALCCAGRECGIARQPSSQACTAASMGVKAHGLRLICGGKATGQEASDIERYKGRNGSYDGLSACCTVCVSRGLGRCEDMCSQRSPRALPCNPALVVCCLGALECAKSVRERGIAVGARLTRYQ
jgi:hypothetical protein